MTTKKALDSIEGKLRKRYADIPLYRHGEEALILSAEHGYELNNKGNRKATNDEAINYDSWPIAGYYECDTWDSYRFGIHGGFCEWCDKNGIFLEWQNPGCIAVYWDED